MSAHKLYCRPGKKRSHPTDSFDEMLRNELSPHFKEFYFSLCAIKFKVTGLKLGDLKRLTTGLWNVELSVGKIAVRFKNPRSYLCVYNSGIIQIHGRKSRRDVTDAVEKIKKLMRIILPFRLLKFSPITWNFVNLECKMKKPLKLHYIDRLFDDELRPGTLRGSIKVNKNDYYVTLYASGHVRFSIVKPIPEQFFERRVGQDVVSLYLQLLKNQNDNQILDHLAG